MGYGEDGKVVDLTSKVDKEGCFNGLRTKATGSCLQFFQDGTAKW